MKRLFTTTALGLVLAASPAMAQTNSDSTAPSAQPPQAEQKSPDSGTMDNDSRFQNQPATEDSTTVRPPEDTAERPAADNSGKLAADFTGYRTSELVGATVENTSGESVGEIGDIIVGADGNANAALISVGGFLGLGQKDVAVPFADLNVQEQDGALKVTVAMSSETLESMPAYKSEEDSSQPAQPETQMKEQDRAPGAGSDTSGQK